MSAADIPASPPAVAIELPETILVDGVELRCRKEELIPGRDYPRMWHALYGPVDEFGSIAIHEPSVREEWRATLSTGRCHDGSWCTIICVEAKSLQAAAAKLEKCLLAAKMIFGTPPRRRKGGRA